MWIDLGTSQRVLLYWRNDDDDMVGGWLYEEWGEGMYCLSAL